MPQVSNPFRTTLNQSVITADVVLTAGQFMEIGRYTVQAGSAIALGFGAMEGQDSAAGRIYSDFNTAAPADIDGVFRVDIHNPQDRVVETIFECRTEDLRTSATDRTLQLPLPFINAIVTEDWALVFKLKADAGATLSKAQTKMIMAATSFEAR